MQPKSNGGRFLREGKCTTSRRISFNSPLMNAGSEPVTTCSYIIITTCSYTI